MPLDAVKSAGAVADPATVAQLTEAPHTELSGVHAFAKENAPLRRNATRERRELGVVRFGHIGKAKIARLDLADERIAEHQVDVIANQHEIAGRPEAVHTASGIRDDERLRTEGVSDARGKSREPDVMSFVNVKAAG